MFTSVVASLFTFLSASTHVLASLTIHSAAGQTINGVPPAVREGWMRMANGASEALYGSPCMMYPYGAVIVWPNNTLLALGANNGSLTGDPTNHGEINAIRRAVDTLAARGLAPADVRAALQSTTLYTNGEPCPMCAAAVRWGGFRELVYGTSIETLVRYGAGQILISSQEVFEKSFGLGGGTALVPGVLANETDPMFAWQANGTAPCPRGCAREPFVSETETPTCTPLAELQPAGREEL